MFSVQRTFSNLANIIRYYPANPANTITLQTLQTPPPIPTQLCVNTHARARTCTYTHTLTHI